MMAGMKTRASFVRPGQFFLQRSKMSEISRRDMKHCKSDSQLTACESLPFSSYVFVFSFTFAMRIRLCDLSKSHGLLLFQVSMIWFLPYGFEAAIHPRKYWKGSASWERAAWNRSVSGGGQGGGFWYASFFPFFSNIQQLETSLVQPFWSLHEGMQHCGSKSIFFNST